MLKDHIDTCIKLGTLLIRFSHSRNGLKARCQVFCHLNFLAVKKARLKECNKAEADEAVNAYFSSYLLTYFFALFHLITYCN